MSNARTPAMMAQSMAESLFRENARLKKIEESYCRLLELDSGDVMIDTLNELDRLRAEVANLKAARKEVLLEAAEHFNGMGAWSEHHLRNELRRMADDLEGGKCE